MTRYDKLNAILQNNNPVNGTNDTCHGSIAEDIRNITTWHTEFLFLEQVKQESTNPAYVNYINTKQTNVWTRIERVLTFYTARLSEEAATEFHRAFFSK